MLKRPQPLGKGKRERAQFSGRGESGPSKFTGLQPNYLRFITKPQPNNDSNTKPRWQREGCSSGAVPEGGKSEVFGTQRLEDGECR